MPQQENSCSFYRDLEQRLEQLRQQGQWRELRRSDYGLPEMTFEGTRYLNLSSNDYLGLANDAALRGEFLSRVQDTRLGATGSRLMTGNTLPYADFEQQLERAYGLPALVFGSGYHANTGVLPALVSSGDLVLADRLVHASILDGVLASKADFQRYRHNDYEHLETLLARNRSRYRYVWIVSETIFSMDGDRADLARLVDLKNRYEALLYLDEAHSIGTDGEDGLGMCRQAGVLEQVDVAVFPMGKAMASHGAFVLAKRPLRDYLVNTSRPMIFSTALPPVCVAWSAFVFSRMQSMASERERLQHNSAQLREGLRGMGYRVLGQSHILPVVFGDNEAVLQASAQLRAQGIWATAIRYPTVPRGEARIRLSVSSAFSSDQIQRILQAFDTCKR